MKVALVFPSGMLFGTPCVPSLAKCLADHGWSVDIYTVSNRACPEGEISSEAVRIFNYPFKETEARERKARLVLGFLCWLPFRLGAGTRKYDLVVGAGIRGLVVVAILSILFRYRPVYNSLELYSGSKYESGLLGWAKRLEAFLNRRVIASIIQDTTRARLLARVNRLGEQPILIFPNLPLLESEASIDDKRRTRRRLGVLEGRKLALYAGSLYAPWGRVPDIVAVMEGLPDDWLFVLQSRQKDAGVEPIPRLKALIEQGKVLHIDSPQSARQYGTLVALVDVGIAWYEPVNENMRYTGWASGKVLHYLAEGKPVIINSLPPYQEAFEEYRCGEVVREPGGIPDALERIGAHLEEYSMGARRLYEAIASEANVGEGLSRLIGSGHGARLDERGLSSVRKRSEGAGRQASR